MLLARIGSIRTVVKQQIRSISTRKTIASTKLPLTNVEDQNRNPLPSKRMQKFHEKLRLDPVPKVSPSMRFIDLMLVETNPNTGELISDAEKDPTKWGDWQNGGRVSDF